MLAKQTLPILSKTFKLFALLFILQCLQSADAIFQCKEKHISDSQLCDLTKDCEDGSDETFELCYWEQCSTGHRCGYGACFRENQMCDGIPDCWDGTDELWLHCDKTELMNEKFKKIYGNCSDNEMQCTESQECINIADSCDGNMECSDGSDETPEMCLNSICPINSFRCAYGACIPKESVCDHQKDCADSSDEILSICRKLKELPKDTVWPIYTRPDQVSKPHVKEIKNYPKQNTAKPERVEISPTMKQCRVPPSKNTLYVKTMFHTLPYTENSMVRHTTVVKLSCVDTYALDGEDIHICLDGNWEGNWPECIKTCQRRKIANDVTINASCLYRSKAIDCKNKDVNLFVGTIATVSCATGYKQKESIDWICTSEGVWKAYNRTNDEYKCVPDCGTKLPTVQTSPWIVSIFKRNSVNVDIFNFTCYGVILTPTLILTHMDCVANYLNIVIVEGNQTVGFNEKQEHGYKLYNLKGNAKMPKGKNDILAYMSLINPLILSAQVRPVCHSTAKREGISFRSSDAEALEIRDSFAILNSTDHKYYLKAILDKSGNPHGIDQWRSPIKMNIARASLN